MIDLEKAAQPVSKPSGEGSDSNKQAINLQAALHRAVNTQKMCGLGKCATCKSVVKKDADMATH